MDIRKINDEVLFENVENRKNDNNYPVLNCSDIRGKVFRREGKPNYCFWRIKKKNLDFVPKIGLVVKRMQYFTPSRNTIITKVEEDEHHYVVYVYDEYLMDYRMDEILYVPYLVKYDE